jgi:prevent-host-death family protein
MREMTVSEASQGFAEVIAAVEHGETIIITKNRTPVAKITPQTADRTKDPEWRTAFVALEGASGQNVASDIALELSVKTTSMAAPHNAVQAQLFGPIDVSATQQVGNA